jgi:protein-S-isoprenylcysteine O-methyltransferase Ste14
MSANVSQSSPPVFRWRAPLIALAYLFGFWLGYLIQAALFHSEQPAVVTIGRFLGPNGASIMLWLSAVLTICAWLVRWWGSSYHYAGVVMNYAVVTETFTASGPYRFVRNPLYLGNVLLALGIGLLGPPPATILVFAFNLIIVYALIGVEERSLRSALGKPYEEYCRQVGRLAPRLSPAHLPPGTRRPNWLRGFLTEIWVLGFAAATCYIAIENGRTENIAEVFWLLAGGVVVTQLIGSAIVKRESPSDQER